MDHSVHEDDGDLMVEVDRRGRVKEVVGDVQVA
jgi:hypothetical protein